MPPSQMLWGKKLDDISDFSWVTERQVSCKKAGASGPSPVVENQQGTNQKKNIKEQRAGCVSEIVREFANVSCWYEDI